MVDKIMYKKTTFIKTDLPDWYNKKSKIFKYYNFNGFTDIMTTDRSNAKGSSYHYLKNFDSDGRASFAFRHEHWSIPDDEDYSTGIYRAPDSATAVYLNYDTDPIGTSILAEWIPELSNWNYVLIEIVDKNSSSTQGFLISEPFKVNSNDDNGVKNVRGVFATHDQTPTLIKKEIYTSTSYSYSSYNGNHGWIYFDNKNQDIKPQDYPIGYWVTFKNKDEYPYKDLFKQVNINI